MNQTNPYFENQITKRRKEIRRIKRIAKRKDRTMRPIKNLKDYVMHPIVKAIQSHLKDIYKNNIAINHVHHSLYDSKIVTISHKSHNIEINLSINTKAIVYWISVYKMLTDDDIIDFIICKNKCTKLISTTISDPELLDKMVKEINKVIKSIE